MSDVAIVETKEQEQSAGTDAEREAVIAEVKAEAEAMDVGDIAKSPEERAVLRYLRRRSQLAAEITHIQEQTDALLRQLKSKLDGLDYVYLPLAQDVARSLLAGKSRSVKTPFGTLAFRSVPARVEVKDEAVLIKAAESDIYLVPCIRVKTEVSRSAVAEHFKKTGEIPPGCELLAERDKFYVG